MDSDNRLATANGPAAYDIFIARQPIFNAKLDVFGHELFFRQCSGDSCALIEDYDDATNKIIADGFAMAATGLGRTDKITVNVGYDNILSGYVQTLPPDRAILEVPAHLAGDDRCLGACEALAAKGYAFLIDNYGAKGAPDPGRMLKLARYVRAPVSADGGRETARIKRTLAVWPGRAIASRVETWEEFEECKHLGFDYFQGFFFARPLELAGRKLSSHKAARLRLLRELADEDIELARIVNIINLDQALTVRLLHFVNSAAVHQAWRVESLARAASIVGLNALKKWAMTAILSDMEPGGKGAELSYKTIHGAFFLGELAENGLGCGQDAGALYLLGLLHNIDALLGIPMTDALEDLPLDDAIKAALLRDENEPLSGYARVIDAVWQNDWPSAQRDFRTLEIPLNTAACLFMRAGEQTTSLMSALGNA